MQPSTSFSSAVRVRRALGRLRRSAAIEHTTTVFSLYRRGATQRLRRRFVRGVWLHTEDYLRAYPQHGTYTQVADTGSDISVGPPTFVPHPPADFPGGSIHIRRHPQGIAELHRPWVFGSNGAVIGADRHLLWDLSYEWPGRPARHPAYALTRPRAIELPGTTVILAAMAADRNYFHFLLNSVARLAYFEQLPLPAVPDRYLVTGVVSPMVRQAFALVGIERDRLLGTSAAPLWRPHRLIAPPLVHHPFVVPPEVCQFLRRRILPQLMPGGSRRRIFIDRSDAPTRRVANLPELQPVLDAFGVEVVRLSGLSLAEQAELFRDAELIIANHGAALANLIFCEPGTRVLQLLAPGMMEREYRTLSQHGGLDHDYMVAPFAKTSDAHLPRKDRDLALPPEMLRQVLSAEGWSRIDRFCQL